MTTTPDRFPGPQEEEELIVTPQDSDPETEGAIRYVSGSFRAKDGDGVFDLRSGSGLSESQHLVLDQLVHSLDENHIEEYLYSGNKVTNVIYWTDGTKTKKIREEQYTYSGNKVDTVTTIQFDGSGSETERFVETYTYSGNKVTGVSVIRSVP